MKCNESSKSCFKFLRNLKFKFVKKPLHFISQSHLTDVVRKQSGGNEKNGKGNRGGSQESKKYGEKIRRMSLSPPPLKMGAQQ